MNLYILYGILLISIGALMSGSFAVPFDKIKNWGWENHWLAFCLFGYVIVPLAVSLLFVPDLLQVLSGTSSQTLALIFMLGMIYGAANLTFGLSLRYLGISLGFAISLGLTMAIGTLVPPLIDGRLAVLFEGNGGIVLITGIIISLAGISISGYSGFLKSRQTNEKDDVNSEFNLKKGLMAALFVGVAGSSTALAIEQGMPLAKASMEAGTNPLFQDSIIFLVLYSGSFVTTLIGCLYLAIKNKTISNFIKPANTTLVVNYSCCALAGFLWYVNFVFFGMGRAQMGKFSFVAWGILMSFTIAFATLWGVYRGEWKGVPAKISRLMWTGLVILIFSSFLIGISGSI